MGQQWVVVLSQSKMNVFVYDGKDLRFLESLVNETSHLRDKDVSRHQPGMIREGGRRGSAHHIMTAGRRPHDIAVEAFVHRAAQFLDEERVSRNLSGLVVIAEPRMMGRLKGALSTGTQKIVTSWIHKDLEKAPVEVISRAILEQ